MGGFRRRFKMADEVKVVKFVEFSETGSLQRPTTLAGLCSEKYA